MQIIIARIIELITFILLAGFVIYNLYFAKEVVRAREQLKLPLPRKFRYILFGNVVFSFVSTLITAAFVIFFFFFR